MTATLIPVALLASAMIQSDALMPQVGDKPVVQVGQGQAAVERATRMTADLFAQCLLKRKRIAVDRALAMPSGIASDTALAHIDLEACLSTGQMQFKGALLRGALYSAMYRRDYPAGFSVPQISRTSVGFFHIPTSDITTEFALGFATCVVEKDAGNVRLAVLAAPESSDESAAYAALSSAMSDCAGARKIRFSKTQLQGTLAEALYRETRAATSAPAGSN